MRPVSGANRPENRINRHSRNGFFGKKKRRPARSGTAIL
jgi:hypothetical protein